MPLAVIAMLVISLLESTFVLPAHLAHDQNLFTRIIGIVFYVFKPLVFVLTWINRKACAGLEWLIERFYQPLLYYSLNNKVIVVCAMLLTGARLAPQSRFPMERPVIFLKKQQRICGKPSLKLIESFRNRRPRIFQADIHRWWVIFTKKLAQAEIHYGAQLALPTAATLRRYQFC